MADVSRIPGPSGPPESSKPGRSARKPGSSSFQDEMQKVDQVDKVDPDEANKRKRPEETMREEELSRKGLEQKKPEPTEKTERSFKVPSSQETTSSSKATSLGGDSIEKTVSTQQDVHQEHSLNQVLSHKDAVEGFVSEAKEHASAEHIIKNRQAEVAAGATMQASPDTPEEEKKRAAAKGSEVTPIAKTESVSETQDTKIEEPLPEEALVFPEEPPPAYTHLHPDVMDVFERMIGALVYLDQAGVKETTITIMSSEEKPSIFNGTQITIREYSTAPKQFNVELSGAPKAVELFQAHKKDIMDAFDAMPYTFKVNNIETSLQ
ncbi:MAG: hypothetical protein V4494_06800 [Chlamydiota bacterium]